MKFDIKPADCAHCGQPAQGYATAGPHRLCRPDTGIDCYRLVTVRGHLMPCRRCTMSAALDAAGGGIVVGDEDCDCQPGTEVSGWHEIRCAACRAEERRIFSAAITPYLTTRTAKNSASGL